MATNDSKTKENGIGFLWLGVEQLFYIYTKVLSVMEFTGTYISVVDQEGDPGGPDPPFFIL